MDDIDFCPGDDPPMELCSNCGKLLPCGTIGLCPDCQEALNEEGEDESE